MSATDRTLIARLGFQDPDRHNPKHDLACRYLCRRPIREALVHSIAWNDLPVLKTRARAEHPISKGQGQYKTTIGFLDVRLRYEWREADNDPHDFPNAWGTINIEVKATPTPTGDVLRQINLYREYTSFDLDDDLFWVLAVTYNIPGDDESTLRQNGIITVRLGKKFDRWLQRRAETKTKAKLIEV